MATTQAAAAEHSTTVNADADADATPTTTTTAPTHAHDGVNDVDANNVATGLNDAHAVADDAHVNNNSNTHPDAHSDGGTAVLEQRSASMEPAASNHNPVDGAHQQPDPNLGGMGASDVAAGRVCNAAALETMEHAQEQVQEQGREPVEANIAVEGSVPNPESTAAEVYHDVAPVTQQPQQPYEMDIAGHSNAHDHDVHNGDVSASASASAFEEARVAATQVVVDQVGAIAQSAEQQEERAATDAAANAAMNGNPHFVEHAPVYVNDNHDGSGQPDTTMIDPNNQNYDSGHDPQSQASHKRTIDEAMAMTVADAVAMATERERVAAAEDRRHLAESHGDNARETKRQRYDSDYVQEQHQQLQQHLHADNQDAAHHFAEYEPQQEQVQPASVQAESGEMVQTTTEQLHQDQDQQQFNAQQQEQHHHLDLPPVKKVNNEQWDAMFARLEDYKAKFGNCLVPKRYQADPKLGTWVETQRVQYKRLERTIDPVTEQETVHPNKRLNAERLQKLQNIGFCWSAKHVRKHGKYNFAAAPSPTLGFASINNSTIVAANPFQEQQQQHDQLQQEQPSHAIDPLQQQQEQVSYESHDHAQLQQQQQQQQASSPPQQQHIVHHINAATSEDGGNAGHDLSTSDEHHPAPGFESDSGAPQDGHAAGNSLLIPGTLPTMHPQEFAHQKRLRQQDAQWEDFYRRLAEYKEKHGDCIVPRKYEADPKLANWVEQQRILWNKENKLEMQQQQRQQQQQQLQLLDQVDKALDSGESTPPADSDVQFNTTQTPMEGVVVAAAVNTEAPQALHDDAQAEAQQTEASEGAYIQQQQQQQLQVNPNASFFNEPASGSAASQPPVMLARRLTKERKLRLDMLGFVWSLRTKRIEDHWDEMFRQLCEYKKQHGDCLVPSRYEHNLKLGKWVETQRYGYTKLMRANGAATSVPNDPQGAAVVAAAAAAQAVSVADASDGSAPNGSETNGSANGGASAKAKIPNSRLTDERVRRLESIGFEWKVKHKMKRYYDKQWDQMFDRLLAFKEQTGHCMVPKRYPPDLKLGTWVHTQRIQYRKLIAGTTAQVNPAAAQAYDQLQPQQQHMMTDNMAVGVATTTSALAEDRQEPSGIPMITEVPPGDDRGAALPPEGEEIAYRLTEERRKRLEEAGFVWSARECDKGLPGGRITRNSYDDQWDRMFEQLEAYKAKVGHCLVPKRCKENPKLGTWVDTQRVQFKKLKKKLEAEGKEYVIPSELQQFRAHGNIGLSPKPLVGRLTDERIARLHHLGFVWSVRDDWQKHYDELKAYQTKYGHCNVPARYDENRKLGIWVSAQRQQYKLLKKKQSAGPTGHAAQKPNKPSPLTPDRITMLERLGFVWTIRSREVGNTTWKQRFEQLKAYKSEHGDCLVPLQYPQNPELGAWVEIQRKQYRSVILANTSGVPPPQLSGGSAGMILTEARIHQLNDIGFAWAVPSSRADGRFGTQQQQQQTNYDNAATSQDQPQGLHLMQHQQHQQHPGSNHATTFVPIAATPGTSTTVPPLLPVRMPYAPPVAGVVMTGVQPMNSNMQAQQHVQPSSLPHHDHHHHQQQQQQQLQQQQQSVDDVIVAAAEYAAKMEVSL